MNRAGAGRRRRGMTLVEVLLALALMVLLSLFVVGVIRAVLGIWQTSERRGRGDLVFAATVEQLRADLDALHNGPRGWLILDRWQAQAASAEEAAWTLPRLRFLAKGAGLPLDDPGGERAVEIAWLLVPEDATRSRLCRLVRMAQAEGAGDSLARDARADQLARAGFGLAVLDGVAWLEFAAEEAGRAPQQAVRIDADQPFDFPLALRVRLERVAGRARTRPPLLDAGLADTDTSLVLRGAAPLGHEPYALIGREWLALAGDFPRFQARARGARDSQPAAHERGAAVLLPEAFAASFALPAAGRRVRP